MDPDSWPISDNYWGASQGTVDVDYDVTTSLQALADGSIGNHGWYLQTFYEHDHLYFYTSELGAAGVEPENPPAGYLGYRPELIVEYTVPN